MTTYKKEEKYPAFRDDDVYNPEEIAQVDHGYNLLATERNYPLISVPGKSLIEIRDEIIDLIEHDEKTK